MRILSVSAPEHHAVADDSDLTREQWAEILAAFRDGRPWPDELPECDFEPEDDGPDEDGAGIDP